MSFLDVLRTRPELREQDYQARISAAETRKAMLRLLPGLEFSAGGHYDSNSSSATDRQGRPGHRTGDRHRPAGGAGGSGFSRGPFTASASVTVIRSS